MTPAPARTDRGGRRARPADRPPRRPDAADRPGRRAARPWQHHPQVRAHERREAAEREQALRCADEDGEPAASSGSAGGFWTVVATAAVGLAGVPLPGNLPSEARLRVFICHECGTTEPVSWCGQRPDCGHSDCTDALERCAAAHRDPLDPRRFHGPVNLAQIDEHLYATTEDAR